MRSEVGGGPKCEGCFCAANVMEDEDDGDAGNSREDILGVSGSIRRPRPPQVVVPHLK